jgi:hypothetical protein
MKTTDEALTDDKSSRIVMNLSRHQQTKLSLHVRVQTKVTYALSSPNARTATETQVNGHLSTICCVVNMKEVGEFLRKTVTEDELLAPRHEPKTKRQSAKYQHKGSPSPVQDCTFCLQSQAHYFLGPNGKENSKFMLTGVTINSDRYVEPLQKFEARV